MVCGMWRKKFLEVDGASKVSLRPNPWEFHHPLHVSTITEGNCLNLNLKELFMKPIAEPDTLSILDLNYVTNESLWGYENCFIVCLSLKVWNPLSYQINRSICKLRHFWYDIISGFNVLLVGFSCSLSSHEDKLGQMSSICYNIYEIGSFLESAKILTLLLPNWWCSVEVEVVISTPKGSLRQNRCYVMWNESFWWWWFIWKFSFQNSFSSIISRKNLLKLRSFQLTKSSGIIKLKWNMLSTSFHVKKLSAEIILPSFWI